MIRALVETKRILVCAGPGGVGKTTTAAAVGIIAARMGRRTLVSTIDPAPRLADALGLGTLSAEPRALPEETARALGITGPGALFAARLDTARAFRRLVEDQVSEPQMRERIFANPIYRQITSTLTGSQEYAATLALHELERQGQYDLIVLDTPPTAHALDFLEAPRRIADAISSPAVQWFARPPATTSLFSWQRLRAGPALAVRRLGKFVGSRFLDDLGAFLLDFRDVLSGFLERAHAVEALLRRPEVGFLLVLSPDVPAISEALYFSARLRAARIPLCGFIANRVLEGPGPIGEAELRRKLGAAMNDLPAATLDAAAQELARTSAYLERLASAQRREIERLRHDAPGIDITTVPLLTHDVSNVESLGRVGDHLERGSMGLRLFLAVDLPAPIAAEVQALCQGLAGTRWSKPAQLHLTLRFLGDTPEAELASLKARLALVRREPFALGVQGVGVFPKKRRPARVLWAGVAPAEPVVALKLAIDDVLGPDPEEAGRDFSPHLTLARFRDDPGPALDGWLAQHAAFASASWPVAAFHLYRSTLGRDGSVHEILQTYPLVTP